MRIADDGDGSKWLKKTSWVDGIGNNGARIRCSGRVGSTLAYRSSRTICLATALGEGRSQCFALPQFSGMMSGAVAWRGTIHAPGRPDRQVGSDIVAQARAIGLLDGQWPRQYWGVRPPSCCLASKVILRFARTRAVLDGYACASGPLTHFCGIRADVELHGRLNREGVKERLQETWAAVASARFRFSLPALVAGSSYRTSQEEECIDASP